jgi:hypothetical protein
MCIFFQVNIKKIKKYKDLGILLQFQLCSLVDKFIFA